MLRPVLVLFRNANFTRAFFAPLLLICAACATPFPIDDLKKDMTYETVRENFGEPEAINEWVGLVDRGRQAGKTRFAFPKGTYWNYRHEEQDWGGTAYCVLFAPVCALFSAITLPVEGRTTFHLIGVDDGMSVVLYFLENKLDHWVLNDPPSPSAGPTNWAHEGLEDWLRDAHN